MHVDALAGAAAPVRIVLPRDPQVELSDLDDAVMVAASAAGASEYPSRPICQSSPKTRVGEAPDPVGLAARARGIVHSR